VDWWNKLSVDQKTVRVFDNLIHIPFGLTSGFGVLKAEGVFGAQ
jgi:hypothetical protein